MSPFLFVFLKEELMKYLKDFVDRERVVLFGLFLFGSFIGLLTLPCWLP